jgi:D-cysteine desulfhydrase
MIPLFEHYPLLGDKLPYLSLGEFPTPVEKLDRLGQDIGLNHLYIKRDDLSGKVYGGNKVRKLEFLLGHALRTKVKEVLTFGSAGSNHALATAIYAQHLGLKSISMLKPQPNAHYVRRNLLMSYHFGVELHLYRNVAFRAMGTIYQLLWHKLKQGYFPQVIPTGGSSPLGATGFVNAAFELKKQIMEGKISEPDRIYVALGSMGTAVGLILGLKAANLKSRVIPVRVVDEKSANTQKMVKLFYEINSFLHSLDSSFPKFEFSERDIDMRHGFFGQKYALFTEEGMGAVARMEKKEGIKLDGTYTGKALAGLIDDAEKQDLRDKVILFWDTYDSRDFSNIVMNIDYHQLPRCFHRYFEEEVQPLDSHSLQLF